MALVDLDISPPDPPAFELVRVDGPEGSFLDLGALLTLDPDTTIFL